MVSLTGSLSIASDALNAETGAIGITNNNITNVNTAFSGTTTGIGAAISSFFTSVSALSTDPADSSSRQAVLSSATQLANAFQQGAASLTSAQASANSQVGATVAQINQLTQLIASLNDQVSAAGNSSGVGGGALEDQRDQLISQLAQLTGVSETQTEGQPTLTAANGSPLVVGDKAYALQLSTGADGQQHITDASGTDVTGSITGGSLGGRLRCATPRFRSSSRS